MTARVLAILMTVLVAACGRGDIPDSLKQQIVSAFLSSEGGRTCQTFYSEACSADSLRQQLRGRAIDLNDDGEVEFMVWGYNSAVWCGNRSCSEWIFRRHGASYEQIGDALGSVQEATSHGYHHVLHEAEVVDGFDIKYLYRFNGVQYEAEQCWESRDWGEFISVQCPEAQPAVPADGPAAPAGRQARG